MKLKILLLLYLAPIICFSQTQTSTDKYIFFGIDLNMDWYTLTNQSALRYYLEDQDKQSKFVITDCDFIIEKIDPRFINLGFQELLLIFQKGFKGDLINLKPDIFLARITYSDINEYVINSKNDIEKSIALLNLEFGTPVLNMKKDEYAIYKWKGVHNEIILTCRSDELTTTLLYTKN